ncbi:MAG: hypothetical protein IPL61_20225 [Myxococcales bacterium]|nr:hypothetical protein [Myxococcales bacterium]
MGWTASYQILRDRPLDDDELTALDDFIARSNKPSWEGEGFGLAVTREGRADRVIGDGWQKLPLTEDTEDLERLCRVLNELATVVAGVELRLVDDFGALGLTPAGQATTSGRPAALVDLGERDRTQWQAPGAWLPPRFAPVPAELVDWLAGADGDRSVVRAALTTLADWPREHPDRARVLARLAETSARTVAKAGLDVYAEATRDSDGWGVVTRALEGMAAGDVTPAFVVRFLTIWRHPRGIYWYGDLALPDRFRDQVAADAEVEGQMRADLAASLDDPSATELVHRRAEHAAHMLGRARTPSAIRALVEAARRLRGTPLSTDLRYHTYPGIHEGLALAAVPAAVPTLLLDLGTGPNWERHRIAALRTLAQRAPARVEPIASALAAGGDLDLIEVLTMIGGAAVGPALRLLADAPDAWLARRAREALAARGDEVPPELEVDLPARVLHRSGRVRDDAVRAIEALGPSHLRCLVVADALDVAVRQRFDEVVLVRSGLDVVPRALRRAPLDQRLAWIDRGGDGAVPPQTWWPALDPIVVDGVAEHAARVPRPWPRLDEASERALVAEEEAVLAVLRAGALDVAAEVGAAIAAPAEVRLIDPLAPAPPPIAATSSAPGTAPAAAVTSSSSAGSPLPAPSAIAAPAAPGAGDLADEVIDELLSVMAREVTVPPALVARAGLARGIASMDSYARGNALRDRLLACDRARVGQRLLAGLETLHAGYPISRIAEGVFPYVGDSDDGAAALTRCWQVAFEVPWENPGRLTDLLAAVASMPPLFAACVDELAAPDGDRGGARTASAFELVTRATAHADLARAAIVARLRADRGRPGERVRWRRDAQRALARLPGPDAAPTALLELAEAAEPSTMVNLIECLAASDLGSATQVKRLVDTPGLAVDAAKVLLRAGLVTAAERARLLAHPFWRVRLVAADECREWARAKVETFAVWAAIDAAGIAVPDDDRRRARGDAAASASWDDLARAHGQPLTLSALAPPIAGAASPCADYRAWALWALDEAAAPETVVARVLADELDRALVARGYPRSSSRWVRWAAGVPELPSDRRARLSWALARVSDELDPTLARVARDGAAAVAATLPPPTLALTPDERAELERQEDVIAARGAALFRDGVPPLPPLSTPAPVTASSPSCAPRDSYF